MENKPDFDIIYENIKNPGPKSPGIVQYLYQRLCPKHIVKHFCTTLYYYTRLGQVRLGQVRLGQVRLGQVRLGQVRIGQARLGQARLGQARLGQVKTRNITLSINTLGQVRLEKKTIVKLKYFFVKKSNFKKYFNFSVWGVR